MKKKVKKPSRSKKGPGIPEPGVNESRKSDVTREKILQAARTVFGEHPYKAASIRMIGNAGDFDHPLIHYYFPSKAELFEAVVEEICEEFYQANISWFEGLERMMPRDGLSLYIDRMLDYNFKHPEPLRIIILNIAQVDKLEEIPGYQHIPQVLARTRQTFEKKIPLRARASEIAMFINSFNSLIVYFLGGSACQAEVLGMDQGSNEYRIWVKDTMMFMFLPRLEKLIFPDKK